MYNLKTKFLSLLLVVTLVVAIVPMNVLAVETDTTGPTITVVSCDKQGETLLEGDTITLTFRLEDESGIGSNKGMLMTYINPNGENYREFSNSVFNYNNDTGLYECTYTVKPTDKIGKYKFGKLHAYDKLGNYSYVHLDNDFYVGIANVNDFTVSDIANQAYTGKAIKPAVEVSHNGKLLENGLYYNLSYSDNVNLGTATITLNKTKYSVGDSRTINFNIVKLEDLVPETAQPVSLEVLTNDDFVFYQGQPFSEDSVFVYATFDEGTRAEVTDYWVKDYVSNTTGKQEITIGYKNLSQKVSIDIAPVFETLSVGETANLDFTSGTKPRVTWEMYDSTIASIVSSSNSYTVSETYSGYIQHVTLKGNKPGVTKLIATNTGDRFPIGVINPVTSFELNKSELFLSKDTTYQLSVNVSPTNCAGSKFSWYSSDSNIVDVTEDGVVTARQIGEATITAASWDGVHSQSCVVNVVQPAESITTNVSDIEICARNESQQISAAVLPDSATLHEVTFATEDSNIAVVSETGVVTAVSNGTTNIIVKSRDGYAQKIIPVTVSGLVEGITVSSTNVDLCEIGETQQLSVEVSPSTALNKKLYWSSSDPSVISVSDTGLITGLKYGTATISVKSEDGNFSKDITATLHPKVRIRFVKYDRDSEFGGWVGTRVKTLDVNWGTPILIEPIEVDGYKFEGVYENFNFPGYQNQIPIGSNYIATKDVVLYCQYSPIQVSKLELAISRGTSFYGDSEISFVCKSTPTHVANTSYVATISNPNVAQFNDGSHRREFNGYNNLAIIVNLIGEGQATLTVTSADNSTKAHYTLNVGKSRNQTGEVYVLLNDIKPSFSPKICSPEHILFDITRYDNADRYVFFRKNPDGSIKCIDGAIYGASAKVYYDYEVEYGKTYQFWAQVYFQDGTVSKKSNSVTVKMRCYPQFSVNPNSYNSNKITLVRVGLPQDREMGMDGIYEVYRSSNNKDWTLISSKWGSGSVVDSGLTAGKKYYYKVRVYYNNTYSDFSEVKTCAPTYNKPIVSISHSSKGYPVLKWNKVSGAKKYEIYYSTTKNGTYKKLTSTSKLTYTHSKVSAGKEYFYKVRAYGKSTSDAGSFSDLVRAVKTLATPKLSIATKSNQTTIKWKKITGATKYELQCSVNGGSYKTITTTTKTSYTHKGLAGGNKYTYRLRAVSSVKDAASAYSSVKSVSIKCAAPTISVSLSGNKPVIKWSKVSGAVKYQVYYATSKSGKYKAVGTVTGTSFTHSGAPAAKACYYKVVAVDKNGNQGTYSSVKNITTKCLAPANVKVTRNAKKQPVITWSKVSGAKKYEVYVATSPNGTYKKLTTTTKLTYTYTKGKAGTTYYFKVTAYGSSTASKSPYSAVVKTP